MTIRIGNAPCSWGVEFANDPRNPDWRNVLRDCAQAGYKGIELGLEGIDALQALLPDSVVALEMPEQKHTDLFVAVTGAGTTTWFTNEVLANMEELPSNPVFALLFKWTKSAPGLRINTVVMKLIGAKKGPTGAFFAEQLSTRPPTRLVPCHGAVFEDASLPALLKAEFDRAF